MQSRTTVYLALAFGALAGSALAAQNAPPQPAPPPLTLVVNIPAFRLDVVRDGEPVRSYGVAVGTPQYPTPWGEYAISTITWNPWWIPPASEWAREDTVTPPGPRNPMGRVKLQLAPSYLIHGTPLDQSIGSAGSHGCVRMHNADVIALARLLQEASGIEMSDSSVTALLAAHRTHIVTLPTPIPVAIVYQTAEVRADTLLLHPDVYRLVPSRREEALAALAAVGLDSSIVDEVRLRNLLAEARAGAVRAPVDALRRRPVPVNAPAGGATLDGTTPHRDAASQACFAPLVSP